MKTITTLAFGALLGFSASAIADVDFTKLPVFPEKKEAAVIDTRVPAGAQYRIAQGKGFRFVACAETRLVHGKYEEKQCLTFNPSKGWSKSLRWYPVYNLLPLK